LQPAHGRKVLIEGAGEDIDVRQLLALGDHVRGELEARCCRDLDGPQTRGEPHRVEVAHEDLLRKRLDALRVGRAERRGQALGVGWTTMTACFVANLQPRKIARRVAAR
jgi:hypothetical protein